MIDDVPDNALAQLTCPYCGRAGKRDQSRRPKGRKLFSVIDRGTGDQLALIGADYVREWQYGVKFFERRLLGRDRLVGFFEAKNTSVVVYEVES